MLVAQPRRLACQTAARRVASEQGYQVGAPGSPIGYSIRFESQPATAQTRTVDFETPGVILRRATADPLLSDVTHLCIDEVHERNADVDLLLALAKRAMNERASHESLPPLQVVLMSATLDSSKWESYFTEKDGDNNAVRVLNVPNVRRFRIDVLHLGDKNFPHHFESVRALSSKMRKSEHRDEDLCVAAADLATWLLRRRAFDEGSILCFLPGIDEIKYVHRLILQRCREQRMSVPTVLYLHSSLSSLEQDEVFKKGLKIILSTNLAETSVTIPDVRFVIDSGRERQFSLLESSSQTDSTVVGSQLQTVNVSQASAEQRAGRTGRVADGVCYRLYTKEHLTTKFEKFTVPEMLRMDLSQLILHTLSMTGQESEHPLQLLLNSPDPPTQSQVRQTLTGLSHQGHVKCNIRDSSDITLTPLGRLASSLPASPRIGRMIAMALVLRAANDGLKIAALMSVPKIFQLAARSNFNWDLAENNHTSDIVMVLAAYNRYLGRDSRQRKADPLRSGFKQAMRVQRQLEKALTTALGDLGTKITATEWSEFNTNRGRTGAIAALICGVSPHIAHLTNERIYFATRDVPGTAKIFPGSINAAPSRRAHWYVYHELRTTSAPFLHRTTAVSPLELALFSEASDGSELLGEGSLSDQEWEKAFPLGTGDWVFLVDQWVPVHASGKQRTTFLKLRRLLTSDMLQQVAMDPVVQLKDPTVQRIVWFVLSALERLRVAR